MEAGTAVGQQSTGNGGGELPDDAPDALARASEADLTVGEEVDALDWLLGATQRPEYDVPFQYETPKGMKRLLFHVKGLDARRMEELDAEHRNGDGPFAKLDTAGFNAAVAAEAVAYIQNPTNMRKVSVEEFLGEAPNPVIGFEMRFKYQPGILDGLVAQIRDKAGYTADRVGTAQRSVVEAAGNS